MNFTDYSYILGRPWGVQSVSDPAETVVQWRDQGQPSGVHCLQDSVLHVHFKHTWYPWHVQFYGSCLLFKLFFFAVICFWKGSVCYRVYCDSLTIMRFTSMKINCRWLYLFKQWITAVCKRVCWVHLWPFCVCIVISVRQDVAKPLTLLCSQTL